MRKSEGKLTTVKLLSKKEQEKAERFSKLAMRTVLLIMWSVVMILIGLSAGFNMGSESGEKIGFHKGYSKSRLLYECDHDRAECEVLTENY